MKNDSRIIGLVALAHGTSHFFQLVVPPLFPLIKADLGVSYAALGFITAVFYILSCVFQPLVGFVVDRTGPRAVLYGGMGLLAGGTLLAGRAPGYGALVAAAAIAGLGNSVFHPADYAILNARVGAARLGHAYSAHGVLGFLGYAAAPVFSVSVGSAWGWHAALLAASAWGAVVIALLVLHGKILEVKSEMPVKPQTPIAHDARILLAPAVLMCFVFFAVYSAALSGVQTFGVAALPALYGVAAAFASSAVTAFLVGTAAGIVAGGFIASRSSRHDFVAAAGLGLSAATMALVASHAAPGFALPALLGLAGFSAGATGPSRDLIVRASTPPGATGRVYGFVYSGLDVGSLSMPVIYGWMMDHALPQVVFYTVFGLTLAAILTVLQLPGRAPGAAIQRI